GGLRAVHGGRGGPVSAACPAGPTARPGTASTAGMPRSATRRARSTWEIQSIVSNLPVARGARNGPSKVMFRRPRPPEHDLGCASTVSGNGPGSAYGSLQRLAERVGLVRGHLDDQPATALERNPHDDAPALLGHLKRTVARPRLHRRHMCSPLRLLEHGYPCAYASVTEHGRPAPAHGCRPGQIGRASCRERVYITVGGGRW